ncbi:putative undecaprenyl-phosphate N-acetylglucosaminyl 1-phosphate transferase [subsurface metagenome]
MPNSVLYLVCFILAGVGAWVVSKFAYKCSLIDIPGDRSSHEIPIPKGGGIGILAAFALASMVLKIPSGFWLSATILALISLHGDRSELSPKFRVTAQFIATIFFLLTSRSLILAPYHSLLLFILWLLFLIIFIVGTANFYNFMDGINGIAAITGIVGFGLLALYSFLSDRDSLFVVLSICISLSCLGFLPFNMPKARVFMGDVGIHRLRRFHGSKIR